MAVHNNDNNTNRIFVILTSLILLFLLGGCAATKKNVWVDNSFNGKVSELYVRFDNAAIIPHKMSLRARVPKITPEFKIKMNNEMREVLKAMHEEAPACITEALESHGVIVKDEKEHPSARLIFTPLNVESHSDQYSAVNHKLWYMVVLTDNTTKRQIWKGEFRMFTAHGRNSAVTIRQSELNKFCGDIAEELGKAGLLPK